MDRVMSRYSSPRRQGPRWPGRLAANDQGTAGIEFSLVAGIFIVALFNTIDVARYLYQRMELENAAQMAAQAAWKTCDVAHLPATTNCPGLSAALTASLRSSSLGAGAIQAAGSPTEGYYCVNAAGALVYVSSVSVKPADCSSVGNPTGQPADYIKIQASYAYSSLFGAISVGATLTSPITTTTLMRLN
jgi:uncharacterized membrane protein